MDRKTREYHSLPDHLLQRELRKSGQLEVAYEAAERHAVLSPHDRRAWARLAHTAYLAKRLVAADRALARLVDLALEGGRPRDATRSLLRRASLFASAGGKAEPLARQALQVATEADDAVGVFLSRQVLAVLAVQSGDATAASEALTRYLRAAIDAGREIAALNTLSRLAVGSGRGAGAAARLLAFRAVSNFEREVAMRWFQEAQQRLPEDLEVERELEKLTLALGLWAELATIYEARAGRESAAAKVLALEQLAELREDELSDAKGALIAYEEALAAGADLGPLREVLRLSAMLGKLSLALDRWKRLAPDRLAEGAAVLEQIAHTDLPTPIRVQMFESLATLAREDLGDMARAQVALGRAEALRSGRR